MRGPARDDLALRAFGPGHVPTVLQPFALTPGATPAEMEVDRGATLRGRVEPPAMAAFLLRSGQGIELVTSGPVSSSRQHLPPYRRDLMQRAPFPLAADGSFAIHGVPAGTWDLFLGPQRCLTLAAIGPGETRTIVVDARRFVPARLRARVLVDGTAEHRMQLLLRRRGATNGASQTSYHPLTEDRPLDTTLPPGDYEVEIQVRRDAWCDLPTSHRLQLAPGQTVDRQLRVQTGQLHFCVKTPAGTPVPDLEFVLGTEDGGWSSRRMLRTDARGVATVWTTAGAYTIDVWPEHLSTIAARVAEGRRREGERLPLTHLRVRAGTVRTTDAKATGGEPVDLVLPAAAGYLP